MIPLRSWSNKAMLVLGTVFDHLLMGLIFCRGPACSYFKSCMGFGGGGGGVVSVGGSLGEALLYNPHRCL